MKIFLIIPAYNEEQIIGDVIERARPYGTVVVVDDGSVLEIKKLRNLEIKDLGHAVIILRHIVNRGQGASLKTGIDYALTRGADIIVTLDSDGQHRPEEIPNLVEPIEQGEVDVVLGSRFLKSRINTNRYTNFTNHESSKLRLDDNGELRIPWLKKWLILKPAIWLERIFTGLELTDAHQGFRAMSRQAAKKIQITQDRMAHATEIVSEIKKHRLRYKEVPVTILYNEFGQGVGGAWRILKDLLFRRIIY